MKIEFEKKYLEELYFTQKTLDKSHRYQPDIIKRYIRCVKLLKRAGTPKDLWVTSSLFYKVLKGDKAGTSAVRINDQYRLEFKVEMGKIIICKLQDITNHYKD